MENGSSFAYLVIANASGLCFETSAIVGSGLITGWLRRGLAHMKDVIAPAKHLL